MLKSAAATALIIALSITMLMPAASASTHYCMQPRPPLGGGVAAPRGFTVQAGTPCVFRPGWYGLHVTGIIERPRSGTAVLRADGSIYYSPKPGFTGLDIIRLRQTDCDVRYPYCGVRYGIWVE
jgi:hypothetical protein